MSGPRLRSLGVDPATGREGFADTRPGGLLDALADTHALKAAAVLVTVVGAVLEAGRASDAELAAFVPALCAALEECVGIMSADVDGGDGGGIAGSRAVTAVGGQGSPGHPPLDSAASRRAFVRTAAACHPSPTSTSQCPSGNSGPGDSFRGCRRRDRRGMDRRGGRCPWTAPDV